MRPIADHTELILRAWDDRWRVFVADQCFPSWVLLPLSKDSRPNLLLSRPFTPACYCTTSILRRDSTPDRSAFSGVVPADTFTVFCDKYTSVVWRDGRSLPRVPCRSWDAIGLAERRCWRSMVKHQPLQVYEKQFFVSFVTGIYGCRWKRYQRSQDDSSRVRQMSAVTLRVALKEKYVPMFVAWPIDTAA